MLRAKFDSLLPHLDERRRRLGLGAEAQVLGHGGIKAVGRAAGASPSTVSRGVDELEAGGTPAKRGRQPGGAANPAANDETHAHPGPGASASGHPASAWAVANLLHEEAYSLQGNAKQVECAARDDRDAQFRYLNDQSAGHMAAGQPAISVDAKKARRNLSAPIRTAGGSGGPPGTRRGSIGCPPRPSGDGRAKIAGLLAAPANTC